MKFLFHERNKWNFRVFCVLSSCLTLFIIFWVDCAWARLPLLHVCVYVFFRKISLVVLRLIIAFWVNFAHHLCSFYSLVASQLFQYTFSCSLFLGKLHEAGRCTHKYIFTRISAYTNTFLRYFRMKNFLHVRSYAFAMINNIRESTFCHTKHFMVKFKEFPRNEWTSLQLSQIDNYTFDIFVQIHELLYSLHVPQLEEAKTSHDDIMTRHLLDFLFIFCVPHIFSIQLTTSQFLH